MLKCFLVLQHRFGERDRGERLVLLSLGRAQSFNIGAVEAFLSSSVEGWVFMSVNLDVAFLTCTLTLSSPPVLVFVSISQ
mgnify:CR=1 FL=1